MVADLNLTKEFFDRQETDDTLQRIREQYLASKKNLQVLMMKQNEEASNSPRNSERLRNDSPVNHYESMVPSGGPGLGGPSTDNVILMNEVRSLKRMALEQQSQISKLTNDLIIQKNTTSELQNKVLGLQSHVDFLENDLFNYCERLSSHSVTTPSTATHMSGARSFTPHPYSPTIEDNTTRLIHISKPK